MLAVEIDLLAHRFTATTFNDRALAEWPPHPARLYSAMVAAWADDDQPAAVEQAALRWFEALGPPTITSADESGHVRRVVVTHFVPVNDPRALDRDLSAAYQKVLEAEAAIGTGSEGRPLAKAERGLAKAVAKAKLDGDKAGRADSRELSTTVINAAVSVLPELRGKQGRTFPTIRLPEDAPATVRYCWTDAQPDGATLAALDAVLARVGRLGHSSTFVSCRAMSTAAERDGGGLTTWRPGPSTTGSGDGPEVAVRLPATGSFDRLTMQYAAHEGREPRTLPSRFAMYVAGPDAGRGVAPRSVLAGPWRVLAFGRDGRVRLTRALDVARAVRGALLSGSGEAPPYLLHGHAPAAAGAPSVPGNQPHLSILPLANVGSAFGDGIVHGIALALPAGAPASDHQTLDDAVRRWSERSQAAGAAGLVLRLGDRSVELTDLGGDANAGGTDSRSVLGRWYWARPSRFWASVTPVALDRYPGRLTEPAWEERAAATIAAACGHVGLPLPEEVEVVWGPPMRGVPAAGPRTQRSSQHGARFGGYRAGTSGQVRLCVHARLRFSEPVAGPVVLGAGRFAGYGLFLPVGAGEADR